VSVTTSRKKVKTLKSGNLHADGTEQILLEFVGISTVSGYVDLSEMTLGDTVVIRQYIKLVQGADYQKYAQETYVGIQQEPVVYITPKKSDNALKVTLQQTTGLFKNFDNNFISED
jgi:hypothetical protein